MLSTKKLILILFAGFLFISSALQAQVEIQSISDEELKSFATALMGFLQIDDDAQAEMQIVLEKEGMNAERFLEIQLSTRGCGFEEGVDVNDEEMKQYQKVATSFQIIEMSIKKETIEYFPKVGFTQERFEQILQVIQNDPDQRQRFLKLKGS